jgi:hypothetical protein
MKTLLEDFDDNVGREDIFKLKTGNESLYKISNDNRFRVAHFATPKNLIVNINGHNLKNTKREPSRHFRNKKRKHMEEKMMSLQLTVRPRTLKTCIGE